jgi:ubiquitin C-terminal hydrolase
MSFKRNDHVSFPDVLDMGRYVYASQAVKTQELERKSKEWTRQQLLTDAEKGDVKLPPLPVTKEQPRSLPYRLRSAVVHMGAINSGHYVTYRKANSSDRWFLTSDEKVEEAEAAKVKATNAYMLFYEREAAPVMQPMSPD